MRRSSVVWVIGMLLFTSGCDLPGQARSIRQVDWAVERADDTSCIGRPSLVSADYHDMNADAELEAVLQFACPKDSRGVLLEIIDGNGNYLTGKPHKLLLQNEPTTVDQIHFVGNALVYRLNRATTYQVVWQKGKEAPEPPVPLKKSSC